MRLFGNGSRQNFGEGHTATRKNRRLQCCDPGRRWLYGECCGDYPLTRNSNVVTFDPANFRLLSAVEPFKVTVTPSFLERWEEVCIVKAILE